MTELKNRPKAQTSLAEQELDKAEGQFKDFEDSVKSLTLDRMNQSSKKEEEPQTRLSSKEISNTKDIYLKPIKSISCRDKFNEDYRDAYNYDKVYVPFIAENKEVVGEEIDIWTRPYAGMPAEEWKVPCNTPVWGPRYLAEQINRKYYHRLTMKQTSTGSDHNGQYYGTMAVDTMIPRLEARPVTKKSTVFAGDRIF